jgi:hypothetical protein
MGTLQRIHTTHVSKFWQLDLLGGIQISLAAMIGDRMVFTFKNKILFFWELLPPYTHLG